MCGIPFAENIESFLKLALLYQAMACKVSTRRISRNKILFGKEALRASVVASGEMDLCEPKSVLIVIYTLLIL